MTNMKRSLSESDCEDVFDDGLGDGCPSQSCQGSDRKKRRGVIEKRRRDRINNSLSELRRLVPAAFEKQGSAKLEKAEILQMTVDHLRMLHAKGINGYNFDPTAFAMDYRSVGFRECVAEVARYLVTAEGMDIQDPLRLRMLSHLQCYAAQRDANQKSILTTGFHHQSNSWNHVTHTGWNSQYSSNSSVPAMISQHAHPGQAEHASLAMSSHAPMGVNAVSCAEPGRLAHHLDSHSAASSMRLTSAASVSSASAAHSHSSSVLTGLPHHQIHSQIQVPGLSPTGPHAYAPSASTALSHTMKPYRPWGTELAF